MATNPMEQFQVHKIGPEIEISGINLSFTNSSLFMVISAGLILILLLFAKFNKRFIILVCDKDLSLIHISEPTRPY